MARIEKPKRNAVKKHKYAQLLLNLTPPPQHAVEKKKKKLREEKEKKEAEQKKKEWVEKRLAGIAQKEREDEEKEKERMRIAREFDDFMENATWGGER